MRLRSGGALFQQVLKLAAEYRWQGMPKDKLIKSLARPANKLSPLLSGDFFDAVQ
jgi:hypothetical protein